MLAHYSTLSDARKWLGDSPRIERPVGKPRGGNDGRSKGISQTYPAVKSLKVKASLCDKTSRFVRTDNPPHGYSRNGYSVKNAVEELLIGFKSPLRPTEAQGPGELILFQGWGKLPRTVCRFAFGQDPLKERCVSISDQGHLKWYSTLKTWRAG